MLDHPTSAVFDPGGQGLFLYQRDKEAVLPWIAGDYSLESLYCISDHHASNDDVSADWYFLLNYTETAQPIKVSSSLTLVIGETEILQPFDVAVWKQTKKQENK